MTNVLRGWAVNEPEPEKKPTPISQCVVCSECGLSWDAHKEQTLSECVRLLKAELKKPRPWTFQQSGYYPINMTSGGLK